MNVLKDSNQINELAEIQLHYLNPVRTKDRIKITTSKQAADLLVDNWSDLIGLLEEFMILLLDRSNNVLGKYLVSKGGVAGTVVDAKIIFACALKTCASGIILAHNHPSGNTKPSNQDIQITKKLVAGAKLLDMQILDHLILTPYDTYYSFADEGLL